MITPPLPTVNPTNEPNRPVLIFVHGTGDTSSIKDPDQPTGTEEAPLRNNPISETNVKHAVRRWWQTGSQFEEWLSERISGPKGEDLKDSQFIERFVWSGSNSELAREDAAKKLLELVRKFDEEDRKVHLLAHSHGGNIVRRMLELGSIGKDPLTRKVRSVTSFGTPFFHYSIISQAWAAAIPILVAFFTAGLMWQAAAKATEKNQAVLQAALALAIILLAGFTFFYIGAAWTAASKISFQRHRAARLMGHGIKWKNFCTAKDEAINLLMSFNRPIQLMSRRSSIDSSFEGPLGCGIFLTAGLATLATSGGLIVFLLQQKTFGLVIFIICLAIGLAAGTVTAIAGGILFSIPISIFNKTLDRIVTSRIRKLAYGSDAGNGMRSVERFPWPGTKNYWVPIESTLESSMETYIADRTQNLFRNFRSKLSPTLPLISHDIRAIAQEILTGDELSHTVYYHMEGFAELIATTLADTGDWLYRPKEDSPSM